MTKQALSVIYVPGLGNYKVGGQLTAVRTWGWWGVEPHLLQMNWHDTELWESKLNRLLVLIDSLAAEGERIGLVGASAGAAAVVNAYAARRNKIAGCVLICGKVNRPEAISEHYRKENPAFVACAYECQKALVTLTKQDRARILSRYAAFDAIVSREDSYIAGARNQLVPTFGHAFTIGTQILFGAPSFLRFLKFFANKIQ